MFSKNVKPKIIVICGPTASGKTSAAIDLSMRFKGEIIGADSMQIYRYMDIGTAKPTAEEQSRVTHHMVSIVDPDDHFDARRYSELARKKVMELHGRGIIPFVVGGTGLYIKALLHGLFKAEASNFHIRDRLKKESEVYGADFLHRRLSRQDPATAKKIKPNDVYRIIRALEVQELTGKTMTELHGEHRFKDSPFNILKIGFNINRDILYDRINQRVDMMVNNGFLEEVKGLLGMGFSSDLKSMQSIGYRHMVDFINGRDSWDETLRTLKRDTRRYAKRQLTWFGADTEIIWLEPGELSKMHELIKNFLQAE